MVMETCLRFKNSLAAKMFTAAISFRKKSHRKANPMTLHLLTKLTFP